MDPAVIQQFTTGEGDIYVRAYRYNTNWTPGSDGVGGEQPMGPEWTAWSKLATTSDVSTLTLDKVTMTDAALASAPSNKYDDLTLLASGQPYTAPETGWFFLDKIAGSAGAFIAITNSATDFGSINDGYSPTRACKTMLKVAKGDTVKVEYTATGNTRFFRFYYDIGAKINKN